METVRSQHNTSTWKHQSDHDEIQVFGKTSQITTKYKYLAPVRSQRNTSIWTRHSDHKKLQVFGNTSWIATNCKYLETVRCQKIQLFSIWKQSDHNKIQTIWKQFDHNEIQAFGNTSQITTNYKSTSQITTKYKYLETPVGLQQNTSKYLETVRSQRNTSTWKQSDHNTMQVFGNTSQITTEY